MVFSGFRSLCCGCIAAIPSGVWAQEPTVEDVARMIAQLSAQVEAAEAIPFPESSEGAAQARLSAMTDRLQSLEAVLAESEAISTDATARIVAALPQFPAARPVVRPEPPAPDPEPQPEPQPASQREPEPASQPEPEPNREPEPAPQPEPQPDPTLQVENLPALDTLTEPLAFGERARRVLSRPGAELVTAAGDTKALPAFSVLYVFAEAGDPENRLLAVGRSTRGADGWVPASRTEDWQTMLVMSYAPSTGRDRTVFFSSADDVLDILDLEEGSKDAIRQIHDRISNGAYDPDRIVAIEPAFTVDSVERPYLMPVLDFLQTSTETHGDVTILQLAALNRDSTDVATTGRQPVGQVRITTEADDAEFRIGIAFVIDTTRSMGPYIDRAKEFVREISTGLGDRGLQDRFDFALVGYRDNPEAAEGVGYLRRVYRDFERPDEQTTLFSDVEEMRPAASSTANWREDAFAGIDLAIGGLNWDAVDTRLVFLITDASPRSVGDSLAANAQMGPETINALAAQRNISLFVLHMQTEEAARVSQSNEGYDDTARGQSLYLRMSQTGDAAISKYFSVKGETEGAFENALDLISGLVIEQLSQLSSGGQQVANPGVADDPFLDAITAGGAVQIADEQDAPLVAAAVAGELFRYRTEYLGARSGVEAPDFYRGWAVDRDIANPSRRSLDVSVFVTREQLSDLAKRLGDIITRLREKDMGMGDFFSSVQAQSGSTVVDPTFRSFLPSYLTDLPYGSKFINMTPSTWDSLGEIGRGQLLDEVEAKLASYNRIYATQDGWIALDGRATEDQVYPMPLRDLP